MGHFFASIFPLFHRNAWYSGYNSSYPFDTLSLSLAQDDKHQIQAMLMQWWEWAWGRYWYHFLSPRDAGWHKEGWCKCNAGGLFNTCWKHRGKWRAGNWQMNSLKMELYYSLSLPCVYFKGYMNKKKLLFFPYFVFKDFMSLLYISFRVQVTAATKVFPLC